MDAVRIEGGAPAPARAATPDESGVWKTRLAQAASLSEPLAFAHRELLDAVVTLERCSEADVPAFETVMDARWRLSKAERHRRAIASKAISDAISAGCSPDHPTLLEHDAIRKSLDDFRTSYVARWTPDRMRADWASYRLAQKEKCRLLRSSMDFERRLVAQLVFAS